VAQVSNDSRVPALHVAPEFFAVVPKSSVCVRRVTLGVGDSRVASWVVDDHVWPSWALPAIGKDGVIADVDLKVLKVLVRVGVSIVGDSVVQVLHNHNAVLEK